mgnify:CR=1 FL=1
MENVDNVKAHEIPPSCHLGGISRLIVQKAHHVHCINTQSQKKLAYFLALYYTVKVLYNY